jgi:hypothetical protein
VLSRFARKQRQNIQGNSQRRRDIDFRAAFQARLSLCSKAMFCKQVQQGDVLARPLPRLFAHPPTANVGGALGTELNCFPVQCGRLFYRLAIRMANFTQA